MAKLRVWCRCRQGSGATWIAGIVGDKRRLVAFGSSSQQAKYRLLMDMLRGHVAAEMAHNMGPEQVARMVLDGSVGVKHLNQDQLASKADELGLTMRDAEVEAILEALRAADYSVWMDKAAQAASEAQPEDRKETARKVLTDLMAPSMVTPGMLGLALQRAEIMGAKPADCDQGYAAALEAVRAIG